MPIFATRKSMAALILLFTITFEEVTRLENVISCHLIFWHIKKWGVRLSFERCLQWPIKYLVIGLCCFGLIQPTILDAKSLSTNQQEPLVNLEINYHIIGAGEVVLVWGINGWQIAPEGTRPDKTVVADVMYSPMEKKGNTFVARLFVPSGAIVDYDFEITKKLNGEAVDIWDTNAPPPHRNYHTTVFRQNVVDVNANLTLEQYIKLGRGTSLLYKSLYALLSGLIVFGAIFMIRRILLKSGRDALSAKNNSKREIGISLNLSRKSVATVITIIGVVNLLLVGTTALYYHLCRVSGFWEGRCVLKFLSSHLNLALEGTIANWYSSMLILFVSLTSVLCFIVDKKRFISGRERFFAYGWLLAAMIFLLLSFDEVASFHERLGMLDINLFSAFHVGWVSQLAIPIGLVAFFLLGFAFLHVSRSRGTLVLMGLGTILYLTVPIQEWIELTLWSRADFQESWQDSLRPITQVMAEEGSELFGTLSFLSSTLIYMHVTVKDVRASKTSNIINFARKPMALLVDAAIFLFIYGLAMGAAKLAVRYTPFVYDSIPANWFPSSLAILMGIICLKIWGRLRREKRITACLYMLFALFNFLISMYYGADMRGRGYGSSVHLRTIFNGCTITTIVVLGIVLSLQVREWWCRVCSGLWIVLLSLTFIGIDRSEDAGIFDFLAHAFLLVFLMVHLYKLDEKEKAKEIKWGTP